MNVSYNKKKVDLYGYNLDNKNNKNIIKEKDGIKSNSKLYKQLDYESNIFYEQNKDIKTKMFPNSPPPKVIYRFYIINIGTRQSKI